MILGFFGGLLSFLGGFHWGLGCLWSLLEGWGFGMCLPDDWSCSFDILDCLSLCKGLVFGDCPIFFSLGSFLGFDFGSLVVLGFTL